MRLELIKAVREESPEKVVPNSENTLVVGHSTGGSLAMHFGAWLKMEREAGKSAYHSLDNHDVFGDEDKCCSKLNVAVLSPHFPRKDSTIKEVWTSLPSILKGHAVAYFAAGDPVTVPGQVLIKGKDDLKGKNDLKHMFRTHPTRGNKSPSGIDKIQQCHKLHVPRFWSENKPTRGGNSKPEEEDISDAFATRSVGRHFRRLRHALRKPWYWIVGAIVISPIVVWMGYRAWGKTTARWWELWKPGYWRWELWKPDYWRFPSWGSSRRRLIDSSRFSRIKDVRRPNSAERVLGRLLNEISGN